jgi:hypothetical protein
VRGRGNTYGGAGGREMSVGMRGVDLARQSEYQSVRARTGEETSPCGGIGM